MTTRHSWCGYPVAPTVADAVRYADQLDISTCLEADGCIGLNPSDVTWLIEHAVADLRSHRGIGAGLLHDIFQHGHQSTHK